MKIIAHRGNQLPVKIELSEREWNLIAHLIEWSDQANANNRWLRKQMRGAIMTMTVREHTQQDLPW